MPKALRLALSALPTTIVLIVGLNTAFDSLLTRARDKVAIMLGLSTGRYHNSYSLSFECAGVDRSDWIGYDDCRVRFSKMERAGFGIIGGWMLTYRVFVSNVDCDSCADDTIPQATWDKAVALVEAETGLEVAWDGGRYIGKRSRINPGGIALELAGLASLILVAAVATSELKARKRRQTDPPA